MTFSWPFLSPDNDPSAPVQRRPPCQVARSKAPTLTREFVGSVYRSAELPLSPGLCLALCLFLCLSRSLCVSLSISISASVGLSVSLSSLCLFLCVGSPLLSVLQTQASWVPPIPDSQLYEVSSDAASLSSFPFLHCGLESLPERFAGATLGLTVFVSPFSGVATLHFLVSRKTVMSCVCQSVLVQGFRGGESWV